MRGSIFLRILAGVILLAALVFLGALIYNAGVAQGHQQPGTIQWPGCP